MKIDKQKKSVYVGFGFGAIQIGLFLYEAQKANQNRRLVVAEVIPSVVSAVRKAGGSCVINIAYQNAIQKAEINGIEIEDPNVLEDRNRIINAITEATEIGTAVPSVAYYSSKEQKGIDYILARGIINKVKFGGPPAVVYTAENNNRAAEILKSLVYRQIPKEYYEQINKRVQFLNTVIGKMSQVVVDLNIIQEYRLCPITPDIHRAFLVEVFNRILISKIKLGADYKRGIYIFEEKEDLLPFEEAKLFGHNATHALIGYLGAMAGKVNFADVPGASGIIPLAERAFLEESGSALIHKYQYINDYLFTLDGYRVYALDLIQRMINPFLHDSIERVVRDPGRKLGWGDRLIGTMRLALSQGICPAGYALGAAAALNLLDEKLLSNFERAVKILDKIWKEEIIVENERLMILDLIKTALCKLDTWRSKNFKNLDSLIS